MWPMSAGLRLVGRNSHIVTGSQNSTYTHSTCWRGIFDVCGTCLWGEESAGRSPAGSAAPGRTRSQPPGCSAGPVRAQHNQTHTYTQTLLYLRWRLTHSRQEMIRDGSSISHEINFILTANSQQVEHAVCHSIHSLNLCCSNDNKSATINEQK